MNNPFFYQPHPLCLAAVQEVQQEIEQHEDWKDEVDGGKMFGVLVAEDAKGRKIILKAYSGQILGRSDWEGWVPAVFDYLQPDGHFKRGEAHISELNKRISALLHSDDYREAKEALALAVSEAETQLAAWRRVMAEHKAERDRERGQTGITTAEMLRQSQFEKAELKRLKRSLDALLEQRRAAVVCIEQELSELKRQRKAESDELQDWLFMNTIVMNGRGEERSVKEIFGEWQAGKLHMGQKAVPPSGAGECCAPKLLDYAFRHALRPVAMAEFWWGRSPRGEIRHHGSYYPACQGKCAPLLAFMLLGVEVDANPLQEDGEEQELSVLMDTPHYVVINKPADMLSVPGTSQRLSAIELLRLQRHDMPELYSVHRLDMQTSGILLLAKSHEAQGRLQEMFARRQMKKRYVAVVTGMWPEDRPREGVISLPLAADYVNRPRQCVDREHGKEAVTRYSVADSQPYAAQTLVYLYPHTGRTHQLRVHCAHPDGLGMPIVGDRLYASSGMEQLGTQRLLLHADLLAFVDHFTGKDIEISCPLKQ